MSFCRFSESENKSIDEMNLCECVFGWRRMKIQSNFPEENVFCLNELLCEMVRWEWNAVRCCENEMVVSQLGLA